MDVMRTGDLPIGESDAAQRAAQVRTRIAAFRELADTVRGEDTGLVLETMEDYAVSNSERDLAAVDLRTAEVPR